MAVIAVGVVPSAEAGVSWFYKFVCEDLLHYFDHSVKRADKALEKFGWARKGFLELGTERLPGGYGLLLRQNYENYFRECEDTLISIAAMAKRAINPEQAEIVRTKIAALRYQTLTPEEVDGTMDWVIRKMSKVPNVDLSKYQKMKQDYRVFYSKLTNLTLADTKADPAQFLRINESAFEAHIATLVAPYAPFEGIDVATFGELRSGQPGRNPMYLVLLETNVNLLREGGVPPGMGSADFITKSWGDALRAELDYQHYDVIEKAAKALMYEGLKKISMGRMTLEGGEITLRETAELVASMKGLITKDLVSKMGAERAANLADLIEAFVKGLGNYELYSVQRGSRFSDGLSGLAERLRDPVFVR